MNVKFVAGRLVFGDPEQIEAAQVLRAFVTGGDKVTVRYMDVREVREILAKLEKRAKDADGE